MPPRKQLWFSWIALGLLALVCGVLGVLQYRWTGEISGAERQRLRASLRERLRLLQTDFNSRISGFCEALAPGASLVEALGKEQAYAAQYQLWKESHEPLFRRVALAVPRDGSLEFYLLDLGAARFAPGEWPPEWSPTRERLLRRLNRERGGFEELAGAPAVVECPRFGPDGEQEWLLAEPDVAYLRQKTFPEILERYLSDSGKLEYDAEIVEAGRPSEVVYLAMLGPHHPMGRTEDASVALLDPIPFAAPSGRRMGLRGFGRGKRFAGSGGAPPGVPDPAGPPPDRAGFKRAFGPGVPPFAPPEDRRGVWLLRVRHQAGSLEAQVAGVRARNLAVSGGLLLLVLATALVLVRLSRRAQRLADLQLNFVAGVSHELRTPLAVIHTAAFNLRGKLAQQPQQVEKYGALIQRESSKLSALVEQVLRFAGAGQARNREPVAVETLVERSLADASVGATFAQNGSSPPSQVIFEKQIPPDLPQVLADPDAMGHALRNLIENAVKYGGSWVGISAAAAPARSGLGVEISVADRGPGIPPEEIDHIFDPFFRGRQALQDQVHGTGLGLNLVKRIVEAHGGSLWVESAPGQGARFVVRLPAAPSLSQT
jgi:signal transduction histidine kinase